MKIWNKELENKQFDFDKLIQYGFICNHDIYQYEKMIFNDFKVVIEIKDHQMTSKIIEQDIDDEYLMVDMQNVVGEFVGTIKNEYENIVYDIIHKCTNYNVFKSNQAKLIIKYIKEKYGDDLQYLWKKFPKNAIWRNKQNNKWYGVLLVISENKLEIHSDKIVEIIDLRCSKDRISTLVDHQSIYPGYHMNKDHWITIKLDESMNISDIYKLIDESYELSKK